MFSLVATIVAILLVIALTIATVYYGGSAFTNSTDSALYAKVLNEGSQISGAATLHRVTQPQPAENVAQLIASGHLSAEPSLPWGVYEDTAVLTDVSQSVCTDLNDKAGVSGIPACGDPAIVGMTVCCQQP